ncbi:FxLYD domain-containing protein [Methanoregula sp.]|uniref:FxLYD domain-containing protein n=1 Tax=Methanoregula sp. TaxID=2052170 RepID=UPI003BAE5D38
MQRHLFFGIGIVFLMILCAGCASTTTANVAPAQTLTPMIKATATTGSDFTLVESHVMTGDYGVQYVAGTVKSNVNKQFTYVQVTVNEYDKDGAQIGSTLANVNNLEPYGTWKFKAVVIDKDAASFKVKEITGW